MQFKRYWALDNPDGWYAAYATNEEPYYNILPLCGIAAVKDGEDERLIPLALTTGVFEANQPGNGWHFITCFLRGSMTDDQEQALFAQLAQRGKQLAEQAAAAPAPTQRTGRTRTRQRK